MRRGRRSGLYTVVAVHSTARGPSLGGCRIWTYADTRAAMRDALRLSRAMTFKSAVADLPLGGGKGVIMLRRDGPPLDPARRHDVLLDFGDAVDQLGGRYVTAEDVGTSDEDLAVVAERTTPRRRAHARPRRLGRSEPVDGAGGGDRHPRDVRAGVRHDRPGRVPDRGPRPRPRRRRTGARARRGGSDAAAGRRGPHQAGSRLGAGRRLGRAARGADRGGRPRRALRARRRARPRHRARTALRRDRRSGEQPARRGRHRGAAGRPRHPLGARLRGQRRRHHQHRRRARARGLRRRPGTAPGGRDRGHAAHDLRAGRRRDDDPARRGAGARAAAARGRRVSPWRATRARGEALVRGPRTPFARSLSRCARRVQRAGSSRPAGIPSQAAASSSSSVRAPLSSAATIRRSRSSRWAMYSSSLAAGSVTTGPWPGHRRARPSARRRRRPSR